MFDCFSSADRDRLTESLAEPAQRPDRDLPPPLRNDMRLQIVSRPKRPVPLAGSPAVFPISCLTDASPLSGRVAAGAPTTSRTHRTEQMAAADDFLSGGRLMSVALSRSRLSAGRLSSLKPLEV